VTFRFCSNFEVDYGSEEQASIVYKTLAVDKEVKKLHNLLTEIHLSAFMNSSSSFLFVTT